MSDFYAELTEKIATEQAVNALGRATIYAQARVALEKHLISAKPRLEAAERQQQRDALEHAIRRVEAECAGRPVPKERPPAGLAEPKPKPYEGGDGKERRTAANKKAPRPAIGEKVARLSAAFRPRQRVATLVAPAVLLLIVIGGGLLYWQWESAAPPSPGPTEQADTRSGTEIAAKPAAKPTPQPAAPLPAERAFLLVEQGQSGGEERQYVGTARWSLAGNGADTVLSAALDFPERPATVSLVMRLNTDETLPASHTFDLVYQGPDEPDGALTDVMGIAVRPDTESTPVPLQGAIAQVVPGQFLFGLSGKPDDRASNLSRLETANWLGIPIRFESKRRSAIVIEKGESGKEAMNKAFAAWQGAQAAGGGQ